MLSPSHRSGAQGHTGALGHTGIGVRVGIEPEGRLKERAPMAYRAASSKSPRFRSLGARICANFRLALTPRCIDLVRNRSEDSRKC